MYLSCILDPLWAKIDELIRHGHWIGWFQTDLKQCAEAGDKCSVNRRQVLAAQRPQPSQAGIHMLQEQSLQI